jgi:DNA-binding NarL/FixJ family response regulator
MDRVNRLEEVDVLDKKSLVRVLLADHQSLFRQGLRTLLATERDCVVVGEAQDFRELMLASHALGEAAPNVIVAAKDLPGASCEADWDRLRAGSSAQLLLLTVEASAIQPAGRGEPGGYGEPAGYPHALPAIPRSEAAALAVPLVRQLARQTTMASLQNLALTVDRLRANSLTQPAHAAGPALTARENEVLQLLVVGNTVKDVASELDLSVKTVEAHKFNLMRKLNIHSRTELVEHARRCGVFESVAVG